MQNPKIHFHLQSQISGPDYNYNHLINVINQETYLITDNGVFLDVYDCIAAFLGERYEIFARIM